MSDKPKQYPLIKNTAEAPLVYFDQAPTLGSTNNVIEIDLAAGVLSLFPDNKVVRNLVCVAHLRGSPEAMQSLREAIGKALKMAGIKAPVTSDDDESDLALGDVLARKVASLNS